MEDKDTAGFDPNLCDKCRLCLEEEGKYQIVPSIQKQFKLCFDIDVEPHDGLSQKVCEKCESLLSQFALAKLIFPERQKRLISKFNSSLKIDSNTQQQQDTVSSTQTDNENKKKQDERNSFNCTPVPPRHSSIESLISISSELKKDQNNGRKHYKKTWQSIYNKQYVCRYCSKYSRDKKGIHNHIRKQCKLYARYSKFVQNFCLVGLNKVGSNSNLTGSNDLVVYNNKKVIQSKKANYYTVYTIKSNENESTDSSDIDFPVNNKKRKRPRLVSRSSNDTVVIEQSNKSSDDEDSGKMRKSKYMTITQINSDIECVNIDDSDTASTKSSVKTKDTESEIPAQPKIKTINDKMINNIITMCSNKYTNRLNAPDGGTITKDKEESSLKHKILSIGRKVIHSKGINATGLLRYMEHKNLEVVWVPKTDTVVTIKTRAKETTDNENSNTGWETITSLPNYSGTVEDFVEIFERQTTIETTKKNNKDKQFNQVKASKQQSQTSAKEKQGKSVVKTCILDKDPIPDKPVGSRSITSPISTINSAQLTQPTTSNQGDISKRKISDNKQLRTALDSERNWKKLLNANPVANPKKLPKKPNFNESASLVKVLSEEVPNSESSTSEQFVNKKKGNDVLHMPIITSTMSLAPGSSVQANNSSNQHADTVILDSHNQSATVTIMPINSSKQAIDGSIQQATDSTLQNATKPQIKVKPVSELMPQRALSQHNNSFIPTTGWTVSESQQQSQNILLTPSTSMVYMGSSPVFTNVMPVQSNIVYYPQDLNNGIPNYNKNVSIVNQQSGSKQIKPGREYVKLHTVQLPNTKTDSPFRYFQNLLQLHNLHLLDSLHVVSTSMICLTKFKVYFKQENNTVTLYLLLFCEDNMFCIKAKDHLQKDLDIVTFSANWQWEILKVFQGMDVVPKLLVTALKFGTPMHNATTYFVNLLKSIVFSKES